MKKRLLLLSLLTAILFDVSAQLKVGDQPTQLEKAVALDIKGSNGKQGLWLPRVTDTSAAGINGLNPPNGLLIYHIPSNNLLVRLNGAWVPIINTDTSINNIFVNGTARVTGKDVKLITGSSPGPTNDFNLAGNNTTKEIIINLPDAAQTVRGVVNTKAQTFAGVKTFNNGVTVNSGSMLNGGTTANDGLTVNGANAFTSNLSLGINAATTAGAQTNKYLSVDASGKVTLNTLNALTGVTAAGRTALGPVLTYNTGTTGTDVNIASSANTITWNVPDGSATARGAVTTTQQTFAGAKTFVNGVTVDNGATLNGGTTANNGLNVSGATTNTSNLTLGINAATTPGAATNRYLTVDAAGKVTLNSIKAIETINVPGSTVAGPAVSYNTGTTGNDFNIAGSANAVTWNLPNASTTARGVVSTTAQTFGGAKTFENGVTVNNGSRLNGGTTANNGLTVTGANGNESNLTLGITSATPTSEVTPEMLTVNSTGKVVIGTTNIYANKPSRMLNYTLTVLGNTTIQANSTYTVNTPLPIQANVSFPASVYISPSTVLNTGTTIDFATIINNNLVAKISTRGNTQPLGNYIFYVTIID